MYENALSQLPFTPEPAQRELLGMLCHFAQHHGPRDIFVVRGYAGTGKTTVLGALVGAMHHAHRKLVLLAPTGRAAKVLSAYSRTPAYTIHKRLYRGDSLNPSGGAFFLSGNKDTDTLFIVDEASMIGGTAGNLLAHLITHVYSSPGCALVLVGDTAQLPPVGETESAAMNPDILEGYGLTPYEYELDHPLRQVRDSGILYNATRLRRRMLLSPTPRAVLWERPFADVTSLTGEYLAEQIADSYSRAGQDSTLVVTRANWRAAEFNRAIRGRVLYAEEKLQRGERLVVAKNNYFWTAKSKGAAFIANGEGAVVQSIYGTETRYGHEWADVDLLLSDSGLEIYTKLLLTCLDSNAPSLSSAEYTQLYTDILNEKIEAGLNESAALGALRRDPYLNAIQAKYGYCLTCHKAQGGQWEHVYIDLGGIEPETLRDMEFHRWLYTAVTRAVSHLYLINCSVPLDPKMRKRSLENENNLPE